MVGIDLVGAEKLLDGKKSLLLGCPCVVVAELVEVYEGFGYRKDEGRMVACGGVLINRGGVEVGMRVGEMTILDGVWTPIMSLPKRFHDNVGGTMDV